ncbi:MAG: hypothetical protein AB9888_00035 [Bacteroidales bacterium]
MKPLLICFLLLSLLVPGCTNAPQVLKSETMATGYIHVTSSIPSPHEDALYVFLNRDKIPTEWEKSYHFDPDFLKTLRAVDYSQYLVVVYILKEEGATGTVLLVDSVELAGNHLSIQTHVKPLTQNDFLQFTFTNPFIALKIPKGGRSWGDSLQVDFLINRQESIQSEK